MIKLLKVAGDSMYPDIKNGQRVVCYRHLPFMRIRENELILFHHQGTLMVKRVDAVHEDGYYMLGTAPNSTDSRDYGLIKPSQVKYHVWFSF